MDSEFTKRIALETQKRKDLIGIQNGYIKEEKLNQAELLKARKKLTDNLQLSDEKLTKQQKDALIKRAKELALLRRRLEDLEDGNITDDKSREIQAIKRKFDREIAAIKGNSEVEKRLRVALEEDKQREISEVVTKYRNIRLKELENIQNIERNLIQDDTEKQIEIEREKSQKIIDEIAKSDVISIQKKVDLQNRERERLKLIEDKINVEKKLQIIENEKLISEARIEQQRKDFKTQEEYETFKQQEFLRIQRKYLEDRLTLLSSFSGNEFKVEIEQIKAQLANLDVPPPKIDEWEQFVEDLKQALSQVGVEIEKNLQRSVRSTEKSLSKQQKAVDVQQARAQNGLTNTLAFEQKELAKREARLLKQQKRLDRVQKLQSYWRTYNANLASLDEAKGEDSNTAIIKTLKSIAVIEGITASLQSFGKGGIVEDKLPKNGVFRGQSHRGSQGGIPIMVEGREGIFSVKKMENIGRDNFYALKDLANKGKLDTNFFTKQKSDFTKAVQVFPSNKNVERGLSRVEDAIKSKPHSTLDVVKLTNGMIELVETTTTRNKTIRNHYKVKKPKL